LPLLLWEALKLVGSALLGEPPGQVLGNRRSARLGGFVADLGENLYCKLPMMWTISGSLSFFAGESSGRSRVGVDDRRQKRETDYQDQHHDDFECLLCHLFSIGPFGARVEFQTHKICPGGRWPRGFGRLLRIHDPPDLLSTLSSN
jgi:hypothetical protein